MSYNGWKNRQTWNVALWIGNDQGLYEAARGYKNYRAFILETGLVAEATPDGVLYNDSRLSYNELNSFIRELHS